MQTLDFGLQIGFQVEHLMGFLDQEYANDLSWNICIKAQITWPPGYQ